MTSLPFYVSLWLLSHAPDPALVKLISVSKRGPCRVFSFNHSSVIEWGKSLWWSILEVLSWCPTYKPSDCNSIAPTLRTHGVVITSFLRRNDAAASFRLNDDVIITSCVHWGAMAAIRHVPFQMSKLCDETKSSAVFSYQQHRLSKAELEEELQYLEALWDELDFDMCVSHGDFHKNNMLYNPSTGIPWDIAITEN